MRLGLRNASCPLFLFSGTKMALKFLRKKTTKLKSFLREYSVSLYLSPCPFIINMYGIAFETDEYYIFAQEYALAGDLFDIIPPQVRWRIKTWVHGDYFYRWIQTGSTAVLFGAWHLVVGSVGSQNTKIHQTFIVKCCQNKSTERSHQGSLTWQHFLYTSVSVQAHKSRISCICLQTCANTKLQIRLTALTESSSQYGAK